jgi:choloylglycine hydrolase
MRRFSAIILITFLIIPVIQASVAGGCTTFVLQGDDILLYGRNLDWCTGTGLIIINPRNLQKVALVPQGSTPAQWVSRYGSVTFNQVGRELPYGGINEVGLVVEQMSLPGTIYPAPDDRACILATQWIQYQLDNFTTVDEVIASDLALRIMNSFARFHFLVCDRTGRSAAIEFLNGHRVIYAGDALPVPALANSTYEASLAAYQSGSEAPDSSIHRFLIAARLIGEFGPETGRGPVDYAFDILAAVSQGQMTKWSIVYDISGGEIHFKVFETPVVQGEQKIFLRAPGVAAVKTINLRSIDFDAIEQARVLPLECEGEGSQNDRFLDYTTAINRESVFESIRFMKIWGIPLDISHEGMEKLARYPESLQLIR